MNARTVYAPRNASTFAPISAARMKVSPISAVRTPSARNRARSARVRMPLSLTKHTSGGIFTANSSVCSSRTVNVRKSRLLTPINRARVQHTRQVRAVVQFNQCL